MAPNWDDIYRDKFNESSKGFDEQRKQYQDAQAAEQAALDKQRYTAVSYTHLDVYKRQRFR